MCPSRGMRPLVGSKSTHPNAGDQTEIQACDASAPARRGTPRRWACQDVAADIAGRQPHRAQAGKRRPLTVTTTNSFASLWLIPRLAGFTREHPGVDVRITAETRVQDLERDGLDVALRHGPASLAGPNAARLFGERVFPVCSPKLLKKLPLKKPDDLKNHVLLQYHDPDVRHPWRPVEEDENSPAFTL